MKLKTAKIEELEVVLPVIKMSPQKSKKVIDYFLEKDYNSGIKREIEQDQEIKKRLDMCTSSPLNRKLDVGQHLNQVDSAKSLGSVFKINS